MAGYYIETDMSADELQAVGGIKKIVPEASLAVFVMADETYYMGRICKDGSIEAFVDNPVYKFADAQEYGGCVSCGSMGTIRHNRETGWSHCRECGINFNLEEELIGFPHVEEGDD